MMSSTQNQFHRKILVNTNLHAEFGDTVTMIKELDRSIPPPPPPM